VRHNQSGDSAAVWVLVLALIGLFYLLQCNGGLQPWSGPAGYQYHDDCCHYQHWHDRSYEVDRHHFYHGHHPD
jgi:hypothetical protein